VIFKVSGTIELNSKLSIQNDDITIAGQTAPGDGICIRNYPLTISANNVIVRFLRSRLGDVKAVEDDAMNGRNRDAIILDHCSMSWSVDECGSFYDNTNFTMQYCLLSESLYESVHDKGRHGYGGIWGGKGATFHHNLLAHHTSRNPRFCGSRYSNQPDLEIIDHRNNVIYNWGGNSCYGAEGGSYNLVGNYYKNGPATSGSVNDRIIKPDADNGGNAQPAGVRGEFYITGNHTTASALTTADNWRGVDVSAGIKEEIKLSDPVDAPAITGHTALEAFEHVLARVGAVLPKRDALDARIIHEALTGTATYGGAFGDARGIIDTQTTVGGWPSLSSTTAPTDTDSDGMPDDWEDANALNKNDPADRNDDMKGEGYTNLEYYLNGLVEEFKYILRPVDLRVDTILGKEVTLSWQDISDNETGFRIERKEGDTWTEIHTAEAEQTEYTDDGITAFGDYYYRIRSFNDELESFFTDSVKAQVIDNTGINSTQVNPNHLQVYPNPFAGSTNISYSLQETAEVELSLLDMTGREIRFIARNLQAPGSYSYSLDASGLNNGIYLVRLKTRDSISLHRVMLAR
jgi:hypothetical protein